MVSLCVCEEETVELTVTVLIQPNLRFFHELFGWEVELAKAEEKALAMKKEEYERNGKHDEAELQAIQRAEEAKRRIYYSWPAFCRDLVSCNTILGGDNSTGY